MPQTTSEQFGIHAAKMARPDVRPMVTEATLIDAFELFSMAGRAATSHSLPYFTRSGNADAFELQSDLYGRALVFARMLAHEDRLPPLMAGVMTNITHQLSDSTQGLLDLLFKWLEQLPAHRMNDETQEVFFLAVSRAEKAIDTAPDSSMTALAQAVNDSVAHLIADLLPRTGLSADDCLAWIVKVASSVMPVWRQWLGGIEPTRLPRI